MAVFKSKININMASTAEGTNGADLACSMNGYTKMVQDIMSLALIAITMAVSTFGAILPADLSKSLKLLYSFIKGSADWMGYFIAAVYYIGLDLGYGELLCSLSQYGYIVIYYLNIVATFGTGTG